MCVSLQSMCVNISRLLTVSKGILSCKRCPTNEWQPGSTIACTDRERQRKTALYDSNTTGHRTNLITCHSGKIGVYICCVRFANLSDLLIMLLKSDFTKGGWKFSWGEPTEAKNPKDKKKYEKKIFFLRVPLWSKWQKGHGLQIGWISKSDTTYK